MICWPNYLDPQIIYPLVHNSAHFDLLHPPYCALIHYSCLYFAVDLQNLAVIQSY